MDRSVPLTEGFWGSLFKWVLFLSAAQVIIDRVSNVRIKFDPMTSRGVGVLIGKKKYWFKYQNEADRVQLERLVKQGELRAAVALLRSRALMTDPATVEVGVSEHVDLPESAVQSGSAWMFYHHYNPDILKGIQQVLDGTEPTKVVDSLLDEEGLRGVPLGVTIANGLETNKKIIADMADGHPDDVDAIWKKVHALRAYWSPRRGRRGDRAQAEALVEWFRKSYMTREGVSS